MTDSGSQHVTTRARKHDFDCSPADVGKRVGSSLYVHKDALPLLDDLVSSRIKAADELAGSPDWSVAKIEKHSVSLLFYETFDEDFPALLASAKIVFSTQAVTRTDYRGRANPPILHRKELLLPPNDPRLPRFRALTAAAEEHGLFANPNRIGTRAAWNALIAQAGLTLQKGRLLSSDDELIDIARHRTAIVRGDLSQPMQLMMRFGIVAKSRTVFDYGCGQGEDVAALSSDGYEVFGWDPHHAASGSRRTADVVNLGFVLNVIEDPRERLETLKSAWGFARQALCIAVIRQGGVSPVGYQPYRDGVVTSRGTFQKYFEQQELQDFVATATGQKPLALAPGVVVVFRDKDLEQEVLLRRHSRFLLTGALPRPPARERTPLHRPTLRERLAPILEALRAIALPLGRLPEQDEAPSHAVATLASNRVAWSSALELLREELKDDESFSHCHETRRNDLLVHLALMQFPGSPKYRSLPKSIQVDIKAFFRNHAAAQEEGRRLLFAAGDRAKIRQDVEAALTVPLGAMRRNRWFRFRSSALPRLPQRLRVLVGCAEVLQGGVEACDFVDIDIEAPRVAMVTCDDIESLVPFVVESVTVDLARQKVFAHKHDPYAAPVYFKSRFLPPDDEVRGRQIAGEQILVSTGLFEPGGPEPSWQSIERALKI
jgi:DNA phosphorothioation-associated putative methyltransferase